MRVRHACRAAVALAAVLAARPAAAQVTPSPPGDPAAFTFGVLKIVPSILFRNIGTDNNVFDDGDAPKRDTTFTLTPRADVTFEPGRLRLTYSTAVDYVYFRRYSSERGMNLSSGGKVELDLGFFRPWASASGTDTRERPNPEIDARARHRDRTYAAGAGFKIGSRTTLSATARRFRTAYDQGSVFRGEDLPIALNSRTDSLEGSIGFDLTPITSMAVVVGHDEQRFDFSSDRNQHSWRVTPAFTFNPGGLLNGAFAIGYRHLAAESAALPDFAGVTLDGAVSTTLASRYHLSVGTTRDVRYSYDLRTPYYVLTGVNTTLLTQLTSDWDGLVLATHQLLDYRALAGSPDRGDDRQLMGGGGVGYRPRPHVRVGVQADWTRRSSPDALRTFTDRRVYSTISWGAVQ